ncbi:DeoR/GlpR family DNA-binding transcription regulator [Aldersonia kunmingensis]|uniref:DeoR/GlpR family DNA-binding transcription regulator n=1 Tax=Aldersonia kunmingensis TaxID=408066 RepID=UPI000833E4F9|nr:DeoR/GlpR family DNA-binding transcription regulator [Aldersonia kunmingensis]
MYAEERQQAIAALIAQRGRMAVTQLSDLYGVTTETVRRDFAVLEKAGLIRRVHGGAIPANALTIELGTAEREQSRTAEKDRIGKAALEYLPPTGGSVLIDAGTTTDRAAFYLPTDRDLLVVTNSIPIASRVSAFGGIRLHLLGGRVRGVTLAAVGDEALGVLSHLRVDVAFVGTNGITTRHGLSTPDSDEAAVKRAIVAAARQVVVLADSSKVGREDFVSFAPLAQVDTIITDTDLRPSDRDELLAADVEVVTA